MPLFNIKKKLRSQSVITVPSKKPFKDHHLIQQDISQRDTRKLLVPGQPSYKQIDSKIWQIRLLKVLRGKPQSPIKCTTQTTLILQDKTPYETVSYCWGPSAKEKVIEVDGLRVLVTKSAHEVLERVRLPDRDRIVWIDAICIDQDDEHEKGIQVGFMGATYQCAERNVIWLGPSDYISGRIPATINAVLADIHRKTNGFARLYDLTHTRTEHPRLRQDGSLLDRSIDLRPLKALFSSPWFGRLWVVQEAALSRSNICHFGSATFALTDVLKVALWLTWNSSAVHDSELRRLPGLMAAANMWYLVDHACVPYEIAVRSTHTLLQIWELLQDYAVSNPKDNIYALLGLYKRWNTRDRRPPVVPKYDKSVSNDEVFAEATRAMIEDSRSLAIFESLYLMAHRPLSSRKPSWALDFSHKRHRGHRPAVFNGTFQADGGTRLQTTTLPANGDQNVLALQGILCDRIAARTNVIQPWDPTVGSPSMIEITNLIRKLQKRSSSRGLQSELATALVGGVGPSGESPDRRYIQKSVALLASLSNGIAGSSKTHTYLIQEAEDYIAAMDMASTGRRFIVTETGRIGLGPPQSKEGDYIAVLYGGALPFILRSSENPAHNEFQIVGESYVHGIMYGEAMRECEANSRGGETLFIV